MPKPYFVVFRLRGLRWPALAAAAITAGLLCLPPATPVSAPPVRGYDHAPALAIVIDDFGQDRGGVRGMLDLPLEITCAIMPNMEFTRLDAEDAHAAGKEVIVHMPMQAHPGDPMSWYGPEPILIRHGQDEARRIAERAIASVPHAVGMNIHVGSESSEREGLVTGVMEVCRAAGFYFLDSYTSAKSVCEKVAGECGVPFLLRHVFLEHGQRTKAHVKQELKRAVDIAKARGSCVCIGHVGPEGGKVTVEGIREMMPYFEAQGVTIVSASKLLALEENNPAIPPTAEAVKYLALKAEQE
jgi:polysaccharide deacetylase 2 family uncharacterized protein YibQ